MNKTTIYEFIELLKSVFKASLFQLRKLKKGVDDSTAFNTHNRIFIIAFSSLVFPQLSESTLFYCLGSKPTKIQGLES